MKKAWILLLLSLHLGAFSPEESGRFPTPPSPATQPPKRLYASHTSLLYLLYALAPETIQGLTKAWNPSQLPYLKESVKDKPVVGGFFGQGKLPNLEAILALHPDLILLSASAENLASLKERFHALQKPLLYLESASLEDHIHAFEALGGRLGKEVRAKKLADYGRDSLALGQRISAYLTTHRLPPTRLYEAHGIDGLSTTCNDSARAALLALGGAQGVHECPLQRTRRGHVKISFEQLLGYQPESILLYERELLETIQRDPKWQLLHAVKNRRLYLVPSEPFNWLDKPPSFMQFLGIRWLAEKLHPDALGIDLIAETQAFYRLFLDVELDREWAGAILSAKP